MNLLFLWPEAGGIGRYAVELARNLAAAEEVSRLVAFVSRDVPTGFLVEARAAGIDVVRLPVAAFGRTNVGATMTLVPLIASRYRLDVLHSLGNIGPPLSPARATVTTLHDLVWLHHPEMLGPRRAFLFTRWLLAASARADRIITDSSASREDIVELLGAPVDKIDVVPLGVSQSSAPGTPERELRIRLGLEGRRIVLCVAQARPHKNVSRLISAFASLDREDTALVIVGVRADDCSTQAGGALRHGKLVLPGWLPESDVQTLYRIAASFVAPSLIEGFGLPVLEAMRHGVPVACSNRSALPETAGDAALYFDPTDEDAIRTSIERLLTDDALASELRRRGRQRAEAYTWERTARETVASYRRALTGSRRRSSLPRSSRNGR